MREGPLYTYKAEEGGVTLAASHYIDNNHEEVDFIIYNSRFCNKRGGSLYIHVFISKRRKSTTGKTQSVCASMSFNSHYQ
jgi:hypothetical protein